MDWELAVPAPVRRALALLGEQGYEAYLVGGCVRDGLLGIPPCDWDLATSAEPQQVISCFSPHAKVVPTGLRHGTVSVLLGGMQMEVTTFRIDGSYTDSRRPDRVEFTRDIRADLARRDFTINAMAYHPDAGLVDPFGGRGDVAAGLIRCVGDPDARFGEDALRILRALRFHAQHGFTIEEAASRALVRNRELLRRISAERIAHELDRLLCGKNAAATLREYHEVFETFLPELGPMVGFGQRNPYHKYDVFEHTLHVLESAAPVREVRLAALLHDCGKPDCFTVDERGVGHFYGHPARSAAHAREILGRLRYDRATTELVCTLVELHDAYTPPDETQIRRWLARLGEKRLRLLFELKKGDCIGQGVKPERVRDLEAAQELIGRMVASGACLTLRELRVGGEDLLALGLPAGPQVGRLLGLLLAQVVDGELENTREALLREASRLMRDPRRLIDGFTR